MLDSAGISCARGPALELLSIDSVYIYSLIHYSSLPPNVVVVEGLQDGQTYMT